MIWPLYSRAETANDVPTGSVSLRRLERKFGYFPAASGDDCPALAQTLHASRAGVLEFAHDRASQRGREIDWANVEFDVHLTRCSDGGSFAFKSLGLFQLSVGVGLQAVQNVIYSTEARGNEDIDVTVRGQRSDRCAGDSASKQ